MVTCVWSPVTNPAVVRLLLLRGDGKIGRVFGPYAPSATTAVDASTKSGVTYSYVVVGLDSANKSVAHTPGVVIAVP